jgi:thiol-disulfide isomerase/thioredoxin
VSTDGPGTDSDPGGHDLSTAEGRYRFLLDAEVITETDDGEVATTEAYDAARGVYHDTYADIGDQQFVDTVASLFGLSAAEARDRIDQLGITREELVAFLTLQSYLDDAVPEAELDRNVLVVMAGTVAELAPVSPVPEGMRELTDDDYRGFLAERPEAVVFVWKLHCGPCDAMKEELDEIRGLIPDAVAVAGIDGERAPEFRRETGVDAAPATVAFADGEPVDSLEGRHKPDRLGELFEKAYPELAEAGSESP